VNQLILRELLYPFIINLDIWVAESWVVFSEVSQPLLYMTPAYTEVFKCCCVIWINSSPLAEDDNIALLWKKWKVLLEVLVFMNKITAMTTVFMLATMDLPDLCWLLLGYIEDKQIMAYLDQCMYRGNKYLLHLGE